MKRARSWDFRKCSFEYLSGVPSKCQTVYVALKNCCCMYCSCCKNTKQSKKNKT